MASVGKLGVEVTANDAELRAVMKRAAEATTSAFGKMSKAGESFKTILGGIGVAAIAGGLLAFAKNTFDAAASLDDMAEKTGASVENLSKLD